MLFEYFAGVCRNVPGVPNEFSCECINEHQGRRCEYGKYCIPNPCLHGGTCIEGPLSFMCLCQAGFLGEFVKTIFISRVYNSEEEIFRINCFLHG